jgi:hypothetical protein
MPTFPDVRKILDEKRKELLDMKNVVIVYTGTKITDGKDTGEPSIVVGVKRKYPKTLLKLMRTPIIPPMISAKIDKIIRTTPTDVVKAETLKAPPKTKGLESEDNPADHRKKFRPKVPAGVSAIVCGSTACTTTCWVWSKYLKKALLLHNWHCAKMNACSEEKIIQPSPSDFGNILTDSIAKYDFGDIENPKTDTAISLPLSDEYATMQVFNLGSYKGYTLPAINDEVIKSGRTSGVTRGRVLGLDGSANISYPDKVRQKNDLIVTTSMLEGGDSSSPLLRVVNGVIQPELCGQGFAGSSQMSLFVKVSNILNDPALQHYQLDFNYAFEAPTPPPPPPEQTVLILASAKKKENGQYDIETVWFEIPLATIAKENK